MQGSDYVRLLSDLRDIRGVEGGMSISTTTPSGTMMSIEDSRVRIRS